ncbi:RHS repeat domain-containing protein [Plantactinospora endophytica]|uniref:Teneurin-like YD-shell domain-containing protein n=1 Tax=Plantactinospora endophytica TaxID=673535 RepID=A0ABQ4E063_9ACTN|nr:RHS repeat-associated core domain-containing protein [Plantactinospora endophytica]GIG88105.1 hypothetical protein Pen02_30410 [Plantactinospora endophytica]
MSQYSMAASAPDVRLTQLSTGGVGDVADSLNLFRGDVNLPLPLVALRGRNGLDLAVTAFYGSNVEAATQPSNRTAPTGVLGVGWSLPREQVLRDPTTDDLYLVVGGSPRQLVRAASGAADEYELLDHQFWAIRRFPDEADPGRDRWEVVREDGTVHTYGLTGVEWGVQWDNWRGSGTAPGGRQFPLAWNLVRVVTPQGDRLDFSYEREDVPIGGPAGAKYTRACYLTGISHTDGQRIDLRYREKEPFEVVPPHPTPPGGAQAFQDRYESRYLDRIEVRTDAGPGLYSVRLDYEFLDVSRTDVRGDRSAYRKRYLSAVTEVADTGAAAPPLTIRYDGDRTGANPGAIRALTRPQGATVRYEYAVAALPNTATSRSVPSPGAGYTPQVWHGPGYTVVTWYSAASGEVRLEAYTWNGAWNGWGVTNAWAVREDTLQVQTGPGCYALSFTDARTGEFRVRLYRQDPYRSGEWSLDPYRLDLPAGETTPLVRLGRDFVAVTDPASRTLLVVDHDPVAGWVAHRFGTLGADRLALAATADACLLGCYDSAGKVLRLALQHRDGRGGWRRSDVLDEPLEVDWRFTTPAGLLGTGDTFAAASFVSRVDEQNSTVEYGFRLVTWGRDFTFGPVLRHDDSQPLDLANPIGAVGISGSTVGNAQHLFRYDGRQWHRTELLEPVTGNRYSYAYGTDVAVAAISDDDGTVRYRRISYDPYLGEWGRALGVDLADPADPPHPAPQPSVSGDVLVTGAEVLRRTPTLGWEPLLTLPNAADQHTVANRAPNYLVWQDAGPDGPLAGSHLVTFDADGTPRPARVLDGESCHLPEPKAGQVLAGPEVCVTYRGPSLDDTHALRLHRIIDGQVDTELRDRAVRRAAVDDGYSVIPVTVEYDTGTATFDPYGRVAQYVRTRLYRGEPADADGYLESVFFNGLRPDVPGVVYPTSSEYTNARQFFGKLNGQLFTQTAVDVHGRPVRRIRNDLYTYDGTNSAYRVRGSFTRRRRTETAESLHLFDADPAFAAELDARRMPAALTQRLSTAGFPLAAPVTVTVDRPGRRFTIVDAKGVELAAVLDEGQLGLFGWIGDVSEFEYNGRGQQHRTRVRNVNSAGQLTERLTVTTFAWEVYPALVERHLFDLAAEVRTVDTRTATVLDRSVSTYRNDWPDAPGVWSWSETYRWDGSPDVGEFDHRRWSGGAGPERGWVRTNRVLAVTPHGLPRATLDAGDNPGGIVYDRAGRFPVAVCGLADPSADEVSWYGFEEYEDTDGWRLTPDGTDPAEHITAGDAFTGRRRLVLPGGSKRVGLRRSFVPARADQPFLLSCWVKTEPGFVPDPAVAGWQVTVGSAEPTVVPVPDTDGRWEYLHHVVTGAAPDDEITVEVFHSGAGGPVLVDAIGFGPLHGRLTATVYDPVDRLPEAMLDQTGSVRRIGYDHRRRPVLSVQDGQPVDAGVEYRWREHRPDGAFDPADPDAGLGIVARSDGGYADFRHGDEWTRSWAASPGWRSAGGRLHYDGTPETGTLTFTGPLGRDGWAARVALEGSRQTAGTVGFTFGGYTAAWIDGSWLLLDPDGTVLAETPAPAFAEHDLFLVVAGRSVLLLADGRTVLSHTVPRTGPSSIGKDGGGEPGGGRFDGGGKNGGGGKFDGRGKVGSGKPRTGKGRGGRRGVPALAGPVAFHTDRAVALRWLAVCGDPVLNVNYQDNAGQARQSQSVGDGTVLVQAWGYDRLGRPDLAAKTVRLDGLPGYRPDLLAPLDPATGRMSDCPLTRAYPADDGYPFSRVRFEASPLGRAVERGGPGAALAINPAIPATQRHTSRVSYGLNLADPVFGLPAGQYRVTTVVDPDGVPAIQLTDRTGAVVATRAGRDGTEIRSRMRYDARGNPVELRQPNSFDPRLAEPDRYVTTMRYDPAGNLVELRGPDQTGPARTVHDRLGRLRFQCMPQQADDGQFSYRRYDRLGRLLEQGTCTAPWNEPELRAHVDEPDWLPGPARWHLRYHYDGDGDLRLLGRLWRTEVASVDGGDRAGTVTTYRYDSLGRVAGTALTVSGVDGGAPQLVEYGYDLTGTATSIRHPDDGVRVDYAFDGFNRVAGVALTGAEGVRTEVAAYSYTPEGQVDTETLRPGDPRELVRRYGYTSAGWLHTVADRHLVERTDYLGPELPGGGSHTGRAMRVRSTFTGVDDPAFLAEHRYEYAYDDFGRLRSALVTPNGSASIGDRQPTRYDPNGNVLARQQGDREQRYLYYPGSNRLRRREDGTARTRPAAGRSGDVSFDADGNVTGLPGQRAEGLRYDPVTGLVTSVDTGNVRTVDFRYDAAGNRVFRSGPDGVRLTVSGENGQPLVRGPVDVPRQRRAREFLVHGPVGLTAVHRSGELQHVLAGRLGSTRAMWDGDGLVAAFNYQPYGELLGPAYRAPGAVDLPYLFTGQELDRGTGLYHLGVRCYDPVSGRMISVDPAGQYPSPYLYAGADPINLIDPTGAFAWSSGAFAAIFGGIAAIIGGLALTILTAGAATPLMIAGALGGGLLIGAGVASAAYGIPRADADTARFDWAQWGVTVGLGAGFGLLSAGAGLALAPAAASLGTLGGLALETALGGALGMADSLATTVTMNHLAGQDLLGGWQTALWAGAAAGGVAGFLGGMLSRGASLRTNRALARGRGGTGRLYVLDQDVPPMGHSILLGEEASGAQWTTQLIRGGKNPTPSIGSTGKTLAELQKSKSFMPVRGGASFEMATGTVNNLGAWAAGRATQNAGTYQHLINDCTTWAKEVLRQVDIYPPAWAFDPRTLGWWARSVGQSI